MNSELTYFQAQKSAKRMLEERQIDPDAVNFVLEMMHDWSPAERLAHNRDIMSNDELKRFQMAIDRVASYEPPQYVVGRAPFYGRTFIVSKSVLIPESETEELVDWVLHDQPADRPLKVLDLGTGSGVIGITLANERPRWQVVMSDVSADALRVAKANQVLQGASGQLVLSDLFDGLGDQQFDLIVTNPPYVATTAVDELDEAVRDYEPGLALFAGTDGLDFYRRLFKQLADHLKPGGKLYGETGYDQEEAIKQLGAELLPDKELTTRHDIADRMRMIRICG